MVDNMAYARKSLADSQNQRVPLYVGSGGDDAATEVIGRVVGGNIVNGVQGKKQPQPRLTASRPSKY